MSKTAIIYDLIYDGKWPGSVDYKFCIKYPDGTEEAIKYGSSSEQDSWGNYTKPPSYDRKSCLQGVINKLENVGYNVPPAQLDLFMHNKITELIIQKSGRYANRPDNAEGYTNRGDDYFEKGDYNRAIADYSQAIKLDSKYAYAYYSRGYAYFEKGDRNHAIEDYNQAIKLDPKDAGAYLGRGDVYFEKGGYDRAIADYTEALKINPWDREAYKRRGDAYVKKGDNVKAKADFEKAGITMDGIGIVPPMMESQYVEPESKRKIITVLRRKVESHKYVEPESEGKTEAVYKRTAELIK
jgi:tetratricopeptide (TPR) repeat protein